MEFVCLFAMLVLVGIQNLICIYMGAKIGLALARGEAITVPNPIEAVKEHREKKEAQEAAAKEQKRIDAILRNVDNYNGTAEGQEDVVGW